MARFIRARYSRGMLVTFTLVRPQHPGNIGSAARAMANFGFRSLHLVAPRHPPTHEDARRLAVGGRTVLTKARVHADVAAALKGIHCVIGTSRRPGKHRALQPLAQIQSIVAGLTPRQRVTILFGSEEHGLHNDELAQCNAVVTIPSVDTCPSLNLAHAVAVVAYELRRTLETHSRKRVPTRLASVDQREAMFTHLEAALAQIGFFPHQQPEAVMRQLRTCFSRAQLTDQEVRILRGIARQILWSSSGSPRTPF